MKLNKLTFIFALVCTLIAGACNEEREYIVYEGDVPIKASMVYMIGSATSAGWNIDSPVTMTADADNPYIFRWEGNLGGGELKLCLKPGTWYQSFIRPTVNHLEINKEGIVDDTFILSDESDTGDLKWLVVDAGPYEMELNLKTYSYSITRKTIDTNAPIVTDALYMIGSATPAVWNIDAPTPLVQDENNPFVFTYDGRLNYGEMKLCTEQGTWVQYFIRPTEEGEIIAKEPIADRKFLYSMDSDEPGDFKWLVYEAGTYHLTFDLEKHTFSSSYEEAGKIELATAENIYIIGDASPTTWDISAPEAMTRDASNPKLFTWTGTLSAGELKFGTIKGTWDQPFLRPIRDKMIISTAGVRDQRFLFTPDSEGDFKWKVLKAFLCKIEIDIEKETISFIPVK